MRHVLVTAVLALGFAASSPTEAHGWAQAVFAYRSPIHEITPFVQVGRVLADDRDFELLFGIAHPIFPWRAHLAP